MNELKKRIRERIKMLEVGSGEEVTYCEDPFEGRVEELNWVLKTIEAVEASQNNEAWGDY